MTNIYIVPQNVSKLEKKKRITTFAIKITTKMLQKLSQKIVVS